MRIETCGSLAHSHPWIFVLTYPEIGQEIRQDFHRSRASSYISYSQERLKRLFYFRYFDEAWKVTRFTEFLWIEWLGGSLGNEIIKVVSRVIAMNFLLCWVCLGFFNKFSCLIKYPSSVCYCSSLLLFSLNPLTLHFISVNYFQPFTKLPTVNRQKVLNMFKKGQSIVEWIEVNSWVVHVNCLFFMAPLIEPNLHSQKLPCLWFEWRITSL